MDEMEGLAIKITRAEWGVLKGWVPEIVANEVAGKLVEVIRPLLADAIAAKDATIAAQAAEIERLKENRDYWMAQYERAYELAQSRAKDAELAKLREQGDGLTKELAGERTVRGYDEACLRDLREQVEEQRRRLDGAVDFYFGTVNVFCDYPPTGNSKWYAHKYGDDYTTLLSVSDEFATQEDAMKFIAANWLPSTQDGGAG